MRILVLICALLLAGVASAGDLRYGPDIPKATGAPHPEGNDFWRRNHMSLMKHDRDLTMHEGDRDIQASLKECFDCHTVVADGKPVTYQDERHFCRSCHDYAAVKVDCFSCHRSTPSGFDEPPLHAAMRDETLRLARAYLEGKQ